MTLISIPIHLPPPPSTDWQAYDIRHDLIETPKRIEFVRQQEARLYARLQNQLLQQRDAILSAIGETIHQLREDLPTHIVAQVHLTSPLTSFNSEELPLTTIKVDASPDGLVACESASVTTDTVDHRPLPLTPVPLMFFLQGLLPTPQQQIQTWSVTEAGLQTSGPEGRWATKALNKVTPTDTLSDHSGQGQNQTPDKSPDHGTVSPVLYIGCTSLTLISILIHLPPPPSTDCQAYHIRHDT
ncbi:unnamed protein product [Protopolystoma xenopodis]|uniref:Uncharacterized protein n=1 Tax=Protopolystoma xenopodis TaxID=117903 RepID=A0A3S5FFL9_9PLAT|nr:unnamed protein product [Protopolystoma xenopodis]